MDRCEGGYSSPWFAQAMVVCLSHMDAAILLLAWWLLQFSLDSLKHEDSMPELSASQAAAAALSYCDQYNMYHDSTPTAFIRVPACTLYTNLCCYTVVVTTTSHMAISFWQHNHICQPYSNQLLSLSAPIHA